MNSLERKEAVELMETLPYRIKKLCENILIELEKVKMGRVSVLSLQLMTSKLLQFAEEADMQSASGGLLRNLADLMPLITLDSTSRISIAESITQAALTRFESQKYCFAVTSKNIGNPETSREALGFISQRMRSASLVSNVKQMNREPRLRR